MVKIFIWLKMNLASLIAALQLVVKTTKELLTAIINVVSIIFPVAPTQKVVLAIRTGLNWIDDGLTKIKDVLVPLVG